MQGEGIYLSGDTALTERTATLTVVSQEPSVVKPLKIAT